MRKLDAAGRLALVTKRCETDVAADVNLKASVLAYYKAQAENVKFYQWKLKRCKVLPVPSPRKAHCHQMIQNKFYIISSSLSLIFSENILMIRIIEGFNICNLHRQFVEQQHQEERSEESVLL